MGAQRATKILGIFARLDKRDGKPHYLAPSAAHRAYLAKGLAHPLDAADRGSGIRRHLPRVLGGETRPPSATSNEH